jgi:hypothetical protein
MQRLGLLMNPLRTTLKGVLFSAIRFEGNRLVDGWRS